jgi:predicted hotdog family 3-hydroxylacyl-ACP dehydratase
MDLRTIDIKTLLPQGDTFLFVDALVSADTISCTTEFTIKPEGLFVENGQLLESGIIENMAQTCAAQIGYLNSFLLDEEVQKGFIGAIRNLNIYNSPRVNEKIQTNLVVVADVMGVKLVNLEMHSNRCKFADCEMKISLYEG